MFVVDDVVVAPVPRILVDKPVLVLSVSLLGLIGVREGTWNESTFGIEPSVSVFDDVDWLGVCRRLIVDGLVSVLVEAGAGVDVIAAREGAADVDVVVVVASELRPDNDLSVVDVVVVVAIGFVVLVRVDVPNGARPPSDVAGLLS